MSTLDNIIFLLKRQNKKQKDLTDYLGISKNSFTDWKSGRIKSYQKYLPQIADFFGVSVDYLLGKEKNPALQYEPLGKNTIRITEPDGTYTERTLTSGQLELIKKLLQELPLASADAFTDAEDRLR